MVKIKITFEENNRGTYDFKVVQDGLLFFKKEYTVSEDNECLVTQAQVFSGFTHYLQDLVNEKLSKDPTFKWKDFDEFKKFAGGKTQNTFWTVRDKYISYPTA